MAGPRGKVPLVGYPVEVQTRILLRQMQYELYEFQRYPLTMTSQCRTILRSLLKPKPEETH